jgi:type II secretory ATPase GspE/PulE/Tfp pilus assembly ATPase PilB-like protein
MIDPKDLEEKLQKQKRLAEENDAKRRAEKLGFAYLDLISVKVPTEIKAMQLVPEEQAKKALLVPLQIVQKKLLLAAFDSELSETKKVIEELKKKYEVEVVITSLSGLKHAWEYYRYVAPEGKEIAGKIEIDEKNLEDIRKAVKSFDDLSKAIHEFKSPLTSKLLEIILGGALALRASDIHCEPAEQTGALRFRIDGVLHTIVSDIAKHSYELIVTRIKLLSNLKINITNIPQDGRFTVRLKDRDIEIRTSIIPSEYGETVVMRLLDPLSLKVNLEELGWRPDDLEIVKKEIKKPNGLILNTGPTGSGKTTTLYAFLKYVQRPEIKIITVEDPVEYHLPGISQTQVDPDANYTFASGLRSILRQDPNVILVGEIRDKETAEIALNAALTGHIVFSTLHTNDAVGAVPRLIDLGAQPQILGPALNLVIAQRLVRLLCPDCKREKNLTPAIKEKISNFIENLPPRVSKTDYKNFKVYEAGNCEKCGQLGYKGRISIFELFVVNETIEAAIYKNPTEIELKNLAKQQGMTTMQEDGILKVLRGLTSFEEVERLTGKVEWL